MLEMPRKTGSKLLSHMLTSHAGEIFIHTLNISRSVLEDPPSVTESKIAFSRSHSNSLTALIFLYVISVVIENQCD